MSEKTILDLFLEKLKAIYDLFQRSSDKKIDDAFVNEYTSGMSDEERDVIAETCDFVNTYYQKRKEMETSGKEPIDWFNDEVEATAKELIPDASSEDVEEFKKGVARGMEERSLMHAQALDEEMSDVAEKLDEEGGVQ